MIPCPRCGKETAELRCEHCTLDMGAVISLLYPLATVIERNHRFLEQAVLRAMRKTGKNWELAVRTMLTRQIAECQAALTHVGDVLE